MPVPAGEVLGAADRVALDQAIRSAETVSRYEFSVFVGAAEGDPRGFAERLHAALVVPDRSVLVLVDPRARVLEVVTGAVVRRTLTDEDVRLAVLAMQADLAEGDLVGGISRGLRTLAHQARG